MDFDAPLEFVFSWCTDYRPDDSRLAGEHYERWILRRDRNRVIYEDLGRGWDGWRWRRNDVHLFPPDRWHADSLGDVRDARLDYRLRRQSDGGSRLDLTMRRRPTEARPRQPPQAELERELLRLWGRTLGLS